MNLRRVSLWFGMVALSVCIGLVSSPGLRADEESEIRKKQAEVERLRTELERAQSELEKVRKENERLKKARPIPVRPSAPEKPAMKELPSLAALPPLVEGEMLEAAVLASYFQQDPAAAEARFLKKKLRVQGRIARFSVTLVGKTYAILLATPEQTPEVLCRFQHQDSWKAVYTKRDGRTLVARLGEKNEQLLGELGAALVVEGICAGVKDDVLVLKDGRIVGK